ncbi:ABC transporter permease [Azospirillum sp. 412522]|nr:ABC transporter permease [Azospirillum sp. 412522]MBY6262728.1 ABC transporter permease [Azospirillum sp. 412522]
MNGISPQQVQIRTTDPRAGYRAARRREALRAFILAVPLLVFLLATFIYPIGKLFLMSVQSGEVVNAIPGTATLLADWPGPPDLPSPQVFDRLAADLQKAQQDGTLAAAARRLNNYEPGFRTLMLKTVRQLPSTSGLPYSEELPRIDKRWGDAETWRLLKRAATRYTPDFLLTAMDREVAPDQSIVPVEKTQAVYVDAFLRTFSISGAVTLICLILGYPVAFLLATLPARKSNLLLIFVIVPFWTSLLVRTTAWYVLLQPNGVVNSLLIASGLTTEPAALMFNRLGVLIGMTHVLLPFMILANYAVMRGIPPVYQRAAVSLGAHPAVAFLRVYVPQTMPGIGTGMFLVFVLSLGYYITPALLGGAGDEMISQLVALQMERQLNWGLAGALSVYLVIFTLAVYAVFNRLVGIDRLRLG